MNSDIGALLEFIKTAEKLKVELRHSYTSDITRQESVAEHSWMMGLMAILFFDFAEAKVDKLKVMKMVVIHDLAEAITGDIPAFESSERKDRKYETEKAAMKTLTSGLPSQLAKEIMGLWNEYELKETDEAKLVQCIDKVEVLIQHNLAHIDTWDQGDYGLACYNKDEYFDNDPFLRQFKNAVNDETWDKLTSSNKLDHISKEHRDRRAQEKTKKN